MTGDPTLGERVHGSPALRRRQRVSRAIVRGCGRMEVEGLHHVPPGGPLILAINHTSLMDGLVVFAALRRPACCLVKSEAFRGVIGAVLRSAGQIRVVRGVVDPAPVRLGVDILRAGGVVGVFPEGTRGDGLVRTAKPGVGYFALRSGAIVLPVACHGTRGLLRTPARRAVRMVVGGPIRFDRHPDHRPLHRARSAAAAERVRVALADLVARTAA
jgi:1-acyl-sn-glycerol-3-phosphate acyltransferase